MRRLLPSPADVDPVAEYLAADRPAPGGRPWLTVGMVASLDGATAVDGRSGAIGGPADKQVFRAVRAIADVILVAGGTVRAESYGTVRLSDDAARARVAAGRTAQPARLAIVTGSLDLDLTGTMFTDVDHDRRPIVFTTEDSSDAERRDALGRVAEVAEVRQVGSGRVDLARAVATLVDEAEVVVSEGGPGFNGALTDRDLVDEWCLSLAPMVVGGDSRRIVHGAVARPDTPTLRLASLLEEDGLLFGRWVRADA